MKIAFLNSIEKETYGGMEEWTRLVSEGLIKRGHEVSAIGRRGSMYLQRLRRSVPEVDTLGIDISGDFHPGTIGTIKNYLARRGVDILFVNFNKDVRLGGIAARRIGGIKVIWSVGINIAENGIAHRLLTPRLIDRIVVPSQALKEEMTQYRHIDPEIVEVIPIGIGDRTPDRPREEARRRLRQTYRLPENATVAVTAARFVYKKGHEYLVDAASEITRRHPDVYFLLLGDGPDEKGLRSQIEKLGLGERFLFAGMVEDVGRELDGCDLMIHPSKEEPFGIALLEGMRAGLPILASRVGGIPEVVVDGESASLFEACNPWAIAEATSELLSDRPRMRKLGEAGRLRWQKDFSYESMIDQVHDSLTRLAGEIGHKAKGSTSEKSATQDKQST